MRFEQPVALALILFVVLLVFVARRTVRARRTVGNLYLWHEASSAEAASLTRRMRRHWLLILQALFLCAVAAAIARPMVEISAPVTLILDASVSMGAQQGDVTRMAVARRRAQSLLETMPRTTRVRIVAAGASPLIIGEFAASSAAAAAAIASVTVTDAAADLTAAIEQVGGTNQRSARIYVFSDVAPSQPTAAPATVEWVAIGQPADNAAITHVSARPVDLPGRMQALVRVVNHGAAVADGALILTRSEAEVARQTVAIAPRAEASYSFALPSSPGVLTVRLDHADALTSDNTRQLVVAEERRIRVHLPAARSVFLQQALAAHPDVVLDTSPASAAEVVVCDGCAELPQGAGKDVANVLLVPSRPTAPATPLPLVKMAGDHPLADSLELDGLDAVVIPAGEVATGGRVIVRGGGVAAVVAFEEGSRRVVEMRLDPDSGTLPFSPAFPLLVSNAVRWLAARDAPALGITAGEPLQWHLGVQREPPVVAGPGGNSIRSTWTNGVLSVADTHVAGLYTIRSDDGDLTIAVNPAVEGESDLSQIPSPSGDGGDIRELPGSAARDVSTALIMGALLLLALEWRYRSTRARPA